MRFNQTYVIHKTSHHIQVAVFVDRTNKNVHILDQNEPDTTSLTNGISLFYDQIKADIPIEGIDKFRFICYCTDGVPFLYGKPGFKPVASHLLYQPFYTKSKSYVKR